MDEIREDIPVAYSAVVCRGTVHLLDQAGITIGSIYYNRADDTLPIRKWACSWKDADELEIEVLDPDRPGHWKYNAQTTPALSLPPKMLHRKMTKKLAVFIWNYMHSHLSFEEPVKR